MTPYTKEKSEPLEKTLNNFYHTKNIKFNPDTDDIFEFVNSLGFEIWKLPLDNENLDGIILAYKGEKKIGLNESLPLHHARFVLAHELAHYITRLAKSPDNLLIAERDRIFHGNQKKTIEHDMDYLAAAILVPLEAFKQDMLHYNINLLPSSPTDTTDLKEQLPLNTIHELAEKYCVSEEVIYRRIVEASYYV